MTAKNEMLPDLSEAQREIMDIVWQRGEVSANEVRDILAAKRDLAKNTVRTLLERMEDKGWLTHREVGRTSGKRCSKSSRTSAADRRRRWSPRCSITAACARRN
jgi:predicted transcriptional regulator